MTERQEVAEKLRAKYKERTMPGFFEPQDVYFQTLNYLEDLESCLPDGKSAFTVLADLIDPTCELDLDFCMEYIVCQSCGYELPHGTHLDETKYCPNCGSRVVVSKDE